MILSIFEYLYFNGHCCQVEIEDGERNSGGTRISVSIC
jgi:hypothetical protein